MNHQAFINTQRSPEVLQSIRKIEFVTISSNLYKMFFSIVIKRYIRWVSRTPLYVTCWWYLNEVLESYINYMVDPTIVDIILVLISYNKMNKIVNMKTHTLSTWTTDGNLYIIGLSKELGAAWTTKCVIVKLLGDMKQINCLYIYGD